MTTSRQRDSLSTMTGTSTFKTILLDASKSPAQRQKSIEYFMNNVDVKVFLVSLKAGGVALNLTEASRVFHFDPHDT